MSGRDPEREVAEEIVGDIYGTGASLKEMDEITGGEATRLIDRWEARLRSLLEEREGAAVDALESRLDYWRRLAEARSPQLTAALAREAGLRGAANDALAGWRYIRQEHGDLYGVGWDRVEGKLGDALQDRPPLSRSAAEVLEAAVEEADAVDAVRLVDDDTSPEAARASQRMDKAIAWRAEKVERFRALLRGEGEEG